MSAAVAGGDWKANGTQDAIALVMEK